MNIKSIINLFRVSKNAAKPISRGKDIVSHIGYQTKPIGDTFLSTTSQKVTFWDVKKLFNGGKIEGGHLYDEMYKIKAGMFFDSLTSIKSFKKWLHSVSLNKTLKYRDYEEIIDFMNLHNGKYIDVWKGFSKTDEIPNIQKLALFVRSIRRIDRLEMYKNMSPKEWETCIDGIINKPREVVGALMRYKYDSRKINGMITSGIGTDKTRKDIQVIEKFIDTQRIKSDLNVFRGEGGFGLFSNVKLRNGKRLNKELEEFTKKIEQGKCSEEEIEKFVLEELLPNKITQKRFLSTAIARKSGEMYAQKVFWHIKVPANSKGTMIESYNVERESEAEILFQKGSNLLIQNVKFDKTNNRWEMWGILQQ